METRIAKLEEFAADAKLRLTRIEARLDATAKDINDLRVDMHKGFADQTKWIIGTALAMSASGIIVMTFVLNYATARPATAAPAPAAIVVYPQSLPFTAAPTNAPVAKP